NAFRELQRQMRLDSLTYNRDLWTAVAYARFSTVWCPLVSSSFTRARRQYADPASGYGADPAASYPAALNHGAMSWVRRNLALGQTDLLGQAIKDSLPAALRGRTLLLLLHVSPYYRAQLTPGELARYYALHSETVATLSRLGLAAAEVGRD